MRKAAIAATLVVAVTIVSACTSNSSESSNLPTLPIPAMKPTFKNVSVHDPSVLRVDDTYYVFGSHLASAKSDDLMAWKQVSNGVQSGNPLIPNVRVELKETFDWAKTNTLWAADVIQLADGKFYMYYNACKGDSPLSALGIAVADSAEGPYKDLGIILKSGMPGISDDGTKYDATIHPNVVDPDVFFDKDGNLWMVYGSYSGGIYILSLDSTTGKPHPGQGYGKKLLGANHSRIEGPYIMYSPESEYYYLFLSYGGLDATGGYNIRVARSKNPDGPYYDSENNDMIDAHGAAGTFFDDRSIEPYGAKLMGNFQFNNTESEASATGTGYVSPGHNSAYYDEESGKYYVFFHTRFPSKGERHELRVHQMLMNSEGWPVIVPHRYAGETAAKVSMGDVIGQYKFINHGKDISADVKQSSLITLKANGKITGDIKGKWKSTGDYTVDMTIGGKVYHGIFLQQWDNGTLSYVMTFSALSESGVAVWGSHVSAE